jgi:K+-sensing histidine kinase KdpD
MISPSLLIFLSNPLPVANAEAARHRPLRSVLDTSTGALLCAWLAVTATLVGQTWPYSPEVLILFIPAIGAVARIWGFAGAMLGLVSALAVFRVGLFMPVGRLDVASADARTSLFWVMLGASVTSYVFARPQRIHREMRDGGGSC